MTGGEDIAEVLEIIRKIDEKIDIARGQIQLGILLEAGEKGEVDLVEIARALGQEKKTIIDAAQKLRKKGLLVSRERGRYVLTEKGVELYRLIKSLASRGARPPLEDSLVLTDIILVVGTSIHEWVPLYLVARELKLSERKIISVIKRSGSRLIKVRRHAGTREIALTYEGQQVYKEVLRKLGLGPLAAKVLSLLTATLKPQEALRRFMVVYALITLVVAYELTSPLGIISGAVWAIVSIYLAFLLYSKV